MIFFSLIVIWFDFRFLLYWFLLFFSIFGFEKAQWWKIYVYWAAVMVIDSSVAFMHHLNISGNRHSFSLSLSPSTSHTKAHLHFCRWCLWWCMKGFWWVPSRFSCLWFWSYEIWGLFYSFISLKYSVQIQSPLWVYKFA